MIKKELRLNKDKDFALVFKTGQQLKGRFLSVRVLANGLDYSRFGLMVGLKISKKAVERNYIKRQIKDVFKNEMLNIKTGYDIIVVVFPLILAKNYQEIENDLLLCFKKLNLYEKRT